MRARPEATDRVAPQPIRPVHGDHDSVVDLLADVAGRYPDHEAFVDVAADIRLSFAEWEVAAESVAAWFEVLGVGQGDVVCLVMPSCADYAIAYQAALRLGAITTGINPRLGPNERRSILARTRPVITIVDPGVVDPSVFSAADGAGRVVRREYLTAAGRAGRLMRRRPSLQPTDPVAIVWTSGTTGVPKGAWFDHACLAAMADAAGDLTHPFDRKLSPLPFAHVAYMTRPWDEIANVVTTVIPPTPWTAADTLALIAAERLTLCQGVPTQYRMVLDHPDFATTDLSSVRLVGTGAARVPPELVRELRDRFAAPVMVRYASTEASVATGTFLADDDLTIATTVGRPGRGVELLLTHDDGTPVATGEVGTVRLRSRAMMRGYWADPLLTAEAFDRDGWLITGDLGRLDERGVLALVGRRAEMYIRGGYNVYPAEVENVLGDHPLVSAVAVTGAPDDRLGEIGVAWVVPNGPPPTLEACRSFARASLADYKAPDRLVIVDALPLTTMLKVDKVALTERWRRDRGSLDHGPARHA